MSKISIYDLVRKNSYIQSEAELQKQCNKVRHYLSTHGIKSCNDELIKEILTMSESEVYGND